MKKKKQLKESCWAEAEQIQRVMGWMVKVFSLMWLYTKKKAFLFMWLYVYVGINYIYFYTVYMCVWDRNQQLKKNIGAAM